MGCRDFKGKDTKLDRFLAKINILKENYCTELVNDHNGKLSKSAKIWLTKSIFYFKNQRNFSIFFFHFILKNINLGAYFLAKNLSIFVLSLPQKLDNPYYNISQLLFVFWVGIVQLLPRKSVHFRFLPFFSSKRWIAYLLAKFFVKSQLSLLDFRHLT